MSRRNPKNTTVGNAWENKALGIGHEVNVSQAVAQPDRHESTELVKLKTQLKDEM